jgi:hypothetical protein
MMKDCEPMPEVVRVFSSLGDPNRTLVPGCQPFVIVGTGGGPFDRWEGPL